MAKQWYILHTYTGHERKVAGRLSAMIDAEGIVAILDIVVPAEQFTEIKAGKKRNRTRVFLPGYLLLEIDFHDDDWQDVCNQLYHIEGVTGFVGTARRSKPTPLNTEEVKGILQKVGEIKGGQTQHTRTTYTEGESVRIMGGPFESFTGTVEEIDDEKGKLRVLVGIFGRVTPVEVGILEVEKV